MGYTAHQQNLMRHLGLRPWVRREIGQEAQAQILTSKRLSADVDRPKLRMGGSGGQLPSGKARIDTKVLPSRHALAQPANRITGASSQSQPENIEIQQKPKKSPLSALARAPDARHASGNTQRQQRPAKVAQASVESDSNALLTDASAGNIPAPLSLIYAQLLPGVWLVAECDEWDRGGQVLFQRLIKACGDLAVRQGYAPSTAAQIEWFHWPLRLPIPIKNDEHNLRQALRGWVNGRRRPGALWISLGRRFVEMLLPAKLDKGVRHQGRSGMDVIWFEGLPAMQIEPEHKAVLWQFMQDALPTAIAQLKNQSM